MPRETTEAGPRRIPPLVAYGNRAVGTEKSPYQQHVESYNPEPTRLAVVGDLAGRLVVHGIRRDS